MPSYAGFIGRFQPWHKGHQRILAQMVADGHKPVLFVGSCNADRNPEANPFNFEERCAIIREACKQLSYEDGSPVEPAFVPVYDYPRLDNEKPYFEGGEKRVPLNTRWFAQFAGFFEQNNIAPQDFTLYYAAKDKDKKNYIFEPAYDTGTLSFAFKGVSAGTVLEDEDLSCAFSLLGAKRKKVELSEENATDIRQDFAAGQKLLVEGCDQVINGILAAERQKNAAYDGQDISDETFAGDPLQVMRHERRTRDAFLQKPKTDPSFHKQVLVIGCGGSLGMPVIENLLALGHDLVLASTNPAKLNDRLADKLLQYPETQVAHIPIDLRDEKTWETRYWEDLYNRYNIDAVINMAGIIEEKPESGLSFENINYKPVPAMAKACVSMNIDRLIYFSTVTARSSEAEANALQTEKPLSYAGSKRRAELALEALGDSLNWFVVRPVTSYNPENGNWGRDMTLPDLANLPVVPVWGSGEQLMQPLYVGDLGKIARLIESNHKGGQILNVVGEERLKLKDILKVLRRPELDFTSVHIPYDRALRLADDYPIGGINRAFIKVCQRLETPSEPVDSRPWAKAVGEEKGLTSLSDVYNQAARGTRYGKPPVLKYACQIAQNPDNFYKLLEDSGADSALIDTVKEAMTRLQTGEINTASDAEIDEGLIGKVIETLGSTPAQSPCPKGP